MADTNFVSWKHPLFKILIRALDPIDAALRRRNQLIDLPPFSARVRSNGVRNQLGGGKFVSIGKSLAKILTAYTRLTASDLVLEIGCGCGRTAIALTDILEDGGYTGVDIDRLSIEACLNNRLLLEKKFQFQLLDVYHPIWNAESQTKATEFNFPFDEHQFDVIYLISVFTHLLPAEVSRYIQEIGRLIKPNGCVLISLFIMDHGSVFDGIGFPYSMDGYWVKNRSFPEKALGYKVDFLKSEFERREMILEQQPALGTWRNTSAITPTVEFSQDILIFKASG